MDGAVIDVAHTPRRSAVGSWLADAERATQLLVGLTVLAAIVRFWGLAGQSYWYDEAFTVTLVHHSPGQMLGLLPRTELTPPFYYCVAWVWARVFGFGEAGLRSLSALAGAATVPVAFAAARTLVSRRAAWVAAALVACNPLLIWYSQEARSYSLLVLLVTVSLLAFARLRERPTGRRAVAWFAVAALTLATHYFGALIVIPEAVALLWIHRRDRRVWVAVIGVGAVGLSLLPLAVGQRTNAVWIARYPLDQRLAQIGPQLALGTGAPARTWLKLGTAIAVLLALFLLIRRAEPAERRGALIAGALALASFVLVLILALAGSDEIITRNIIVGLVPLIVLVAGGLGAGRKGWLGVAGAGILCIVGLTAAVAVKVDSTLQRPAWRELARVIDVRRSPGVRSAILMENYYPGIEPLAVYLPGLHFVRPRGVRVNEIDLIAAGKVPHAYFCWWGSTCNVVPARLDTTIRVPGFRPVGPVLHAGQFSVLRLRAARRVRVTWRMAGRAFVGQRLRLLFFTLVSQAPS